MTTADDLGIRGIDEIEPLDLEGSAIYRGRQRTHNRLVAIKILDPLQEPLVPRRFDIRRKALNRFADLPGVVSVYESGTTSSASQYLVMPYFPLGSLADQMAHGPTPWHRATELVIQAAQIVGRGHDLGVVLSDLKPSSVLLADASSPLIAVYGMATRRFDDGSASYAAPETQRGGASTTSSDVYSLALTLAALIAGRPPNRGHPSIEFMAEVQALAPARILEVIEHGLAEGQANRYGTGNQLATALQGALAGEPDLQGSALSGAEPDPIDWDALFGPPVPARRDVQPPHLANGATNGSTTNATTTTNGTTTNGAANGSVTNGSVVDGIHANGAASNEPPGADDEIDLSDKAEPVIDLTEADALPADDLDDPLGIDADWNPAQPIPQPPTPPSPGRPRSHQLSGSMSGGATAVIVEELTGAGAPSAAMGAAHEAASNDVVEPQVDADEAGTVAYETAEPEVISEPEVIGEPEAVAYETAEPEVIGEPEVDASGAPDTAAAIAIDLSPATGTEPGSGEAEPDVDPAQDLRPADDLRAGPDAATTVAPPARPKAWLRPTEDEPQVSSPVEALPAAASASPEPVDTIGPPLPPTGDELPFRAFERQHLPELPSNPVRRYLEEAQGSYFNRRRSYGGLLALIGLAVIAGVVLWLMLRDLKSSPAPVRSDSTFTTYIDSSDADAASPTVAPPVLQEPPATNGTTTTTRPRPRPTATTAAVASTATVASPSAPAPSVSAAPAPTAPPSESVTTATPLPTVTVPPTGVTTATTSPKTTRTTRPKATAPTVAPQGLTMPLIDSAEVTRIRATSARISVTSPSCVRAVFSYAAVGGAASQITSSTCATAHTLLLGIVTPSLTSGTSYTVTVTVTDSAGSSVAQTLSFTTLG